MANSTKCNYIFCWCYFPITYSQYAYVILEGKVQSHVVPGYLADSCHQSTTLGWRADTRQPDGRAVVWDKDLCRHQTTVMSATVCCLFADNLGYLLPLTKTFLLLHGTVQTVSTVPVWKSLSDELRNSDNFEALNDSCKFFLAVTSVTSTLEVIFYLLTAI